MCEAPLLMIGSKKGTATKYIGDPFTLARLLFFPSAALRFPMVLIAGMIHLFHRSEFFGRKAISLLALAFEIHRQFWVFVF
jgi:hypothetical protein